ncbi:endopeptidase La [Flavobacteriales bacterium]|nr:endopeptidase La [Flavobacteriales bacterium]
MTNTLLQNIYLGESEDFTDLIPLMSTDDEKRLNALKVPAIIPILPLRNTVLFPGVVIPITVSRDKSINLINDAYKKKQVIGVLSQIHPDKEEPQAEDLNKIGTVAKILRLFKMPDGNLTIIIQGQKRFSVAKIVSSEPYFQAEVSKFLELKPRKNNVNFKALVSSLRDVALRIIKESPNIPSDATFAINNIESDSFLVNFVSSNMNLKVVEKQKMLEEPKLFIRTQMVLTHLNKELKMLQMKNEIQSKVKSELDDQQREYLLNQQLKTIQEELGVNVFQEEIESMKKLSKDKKWHKEVSDHFNKELSKLQRMNPQVAEYGVQRNYVETLLDLPWNNYTKDVFNLKRVKKILNKDHYGLEKVKERIIEHLAVLKLRGDMRAPIICLYGPPGVGKTSLGKSIAESLNRKYIRVSLGGMRDQSEIRGHRKTYIGAMPGRIIQSIRKAGSSNPVFVLDEIDKLSRDNYGDPSSAMLEMLDPEQNKNFYDNYLEIGFDLSKVLFIATANDLSTIQPALLDRMEIINISGYNIKEKLHIAKKHLLPKALIENGVRKTLILTDKCLEKIIESYTRESGVRGLEKVLSKLARSQAVKIAKGHRVISDLTYDSVESVLGIQKYNKEVYDQSQFVGVAIGLAWTPVGGDILFIETSMSFGKGKLSITGNLGKVMKESAILALEYLKFKSNEYSIDTDMFEKRDFHVHVPEGAIPKDGPSAGITILTALVSLLLSRKIKKSLALTGEITLRGRVLPVGGIKEKILAANRAGIKQIVLSEDNKKDIKDIKPTYLKGLKFHYVNTMEEVIDLVLLKK